MCCCYYLLLSSLLQGLLQQVLGGNEDVVVTAGKKGPSTENAFFQLEVHTPVLITGLPLSLPLPNTSICNKFELGRRCKRKCIVGTRTGDTKQGCEDCAHDVMSESEHANSCQRELQSQGSVRLLVSTSRQLQFRYTSASTITGSSNSSDNMIVTVVMVMTSITTRRRIVTIPIIMLSSS